MAAAQVQLYSTATNTQVGSIATADASGRYAISSIPDGSYKLFITPPLGSQFNPAWITDPVIVFNGGDLVRDVTLLLPSSSVSGTVRSPAGAGASNIKVCAYQSSSYSSKCATSDSNGAYAITGLDSGSYRIDVSGGKAYVGDSNVATPYGFSITGFVSALSVNGAVPQDVTLPFVTLSGKTTAGNGAGVSGVNVSVPYTTWGANGASYVCRNDGYSSSSVVSGADGSYSLVLLSYGNYSINLTPPSGSAVIATTLNGVDASASTSRNFVLKPANSVSGTVRNPAGAGASNIKVCAYQSSSYSSNCATSDSTGAYAITGLDSGSYRIDVSGGKGYVGDSNVATPYGFNITGFVSALSVNGAVPQDVTLPFVTLSGKTTAGNGAGVSGVNVAVPYTTWGANGVSYVCRNDGYSSSSVVSGADGSYSLVLLSYGNYSINLTPPSGSAVIATTLNGVDASASTTKNLALKPANSVSGTVRNPAGAGASNIKVCAYQSSSYSSNCATSDSTGAYAITGLDSGSYRIDVSGGKGYVGDSNIATPYGFSITGFVPALSVNGAVPQNVTLPFVTLSGNTTDGNGAGVSGVNVAVPYTTWGANGVSYVCRNDGYSTYSVVSGADGSYSLVLLSYGNYSINLTPPSGSAVIATTLNGVDASASTMKNLALKPASSVSGTVRNPAGAGASNIKVCAYQSSSYSSKCATSDSTGAYAITGLDSGSYRIDVSGGKGYVGDSNVATPYGFSITGFLPALSVNGAVPQDVTLPFVTLSGKTTDGNGAGVSGVNVAVPYTTWGANGVSYVCRNDGYSSYSVVSGADGSYSLVLLSYGNYSINLTPPSGSAVIATTLNGVDASASTTKNLALKPASSVSGTVRNPAGAGASNIKVCAYQSSSYSSKCATSDSTGAYAITGLDSGSYRIDVSGGKGYVGDSNVATPYGFSITGFVPALSVNGAVPQNVTLPFVTLSGKTTDSNGTGVSGVRISVPYTTWGANGVSYVCRNDGYSSYSVVSDAAGNFSMVLLGYGSYGLDIYAPAGGQYVDATISGYSMTESKVQNIVLSKSVAQRKLSLALTGTGAGAVSSSPAGISSQGLPVSWFFDAGSQVTLTATSASGSSFAGWTGACSGTDVCTVTLTSDLSVGARFEKYPILTVTLSGTGSGNVNSVPSLITCSSGSCTADLAPGSNVTLIATPDGNSTFDGWQGACVNKSGNCTITATEPASVSATFTKAAPVTLVSSSRTPFPLLQSAYLAASTGAVIESRAGEFAEQLVFGRAITVNIEGGLDPSYAEVTGTSTISGFLKIRNGTVRVKNISVH
jgi:uncharacterized protein YjfI (DUF2170 family)